MYEDKKRKIAKTVIVVVFIGLPVLVMFYDIALGGPDAFVWYVRHTSCISMDWQ